MSKAKHNEAAHPQPRLAVHVSLFFFRWRSPRHATRRLTRAASPPSHHRARLRPHAKCAARRRVRADRRRRKRYDTTYYTDPSKPGRGDREVKRGDSATVHVVAKIRDTGRVIMNTREAGMVPYAGVFGANGVIKGWDVAMMGARVAERRIVRVPAHEAFGAEGDKHLGVPGGSDLELDLTILQIRANKGKIRDESRGAPPPKEGEEDTAHIFGEEPRWPDEL